MEARARLPSLLRRPASILVALAIVSVVASSPGTVSGRPAQRSAASDRISTQVPAAHPPAAQTSLAPLLRGADQEPTGPIASAASVPSFSHIYLVVMENHEYGSIVGSSHAPYINSLIRRYGLATNDHAVTHPSEPNYLALFAGSTFGIRDDGIHNVAHSQSRRPARGARSDMARLRSGSAEPVLHGRRRSRRSRPRRSGGLVRTQARAGGELHRHLEEPVALCSRITHLTGFSPTAANFELIVPNMTNDMHDGTVAQGDAFLRAFVPRITGSSAFATSLLVITWDEGSTRVGGGGHVATIVVSPRVKAGFRSAVSHSHYSLLRTIQDAWGLGCLNHTCTSNDLREFFR